MKTPMAKRVALESAAFRGVDPELFFPHSELFGPCDTEPSPVGISVAETYPGGDPWHLNSVVDSIHIDIDSTDTLSPFDIKRVHYPPLSDDDCVQ